MEERVKLLYVSMTMKEKRRENLERITREYGTQLRMNRSIQAGLLSKTEGLDKCAFSAVQVL